MNTQIITTPAGDRLVVLPEADYEALVAAAEDAADIATVRRFKERLASGEEELVPAAIVDRLVAGENAIRVWREHRGLSASSLAEKAGIAQAFLSQIETGKRDGTVTTLKKIADALSVKIDDLI
ncbi:helix-turn-helix domain-containing protein [Ancylobacter sp. IITR112]|uniref:helix-turn-helix domain-containing protein n=1 Tax=Ancylobacter sp. IITR112 TaxID=3138073 RepID=UPI00352A07C4